MSRTPEDRKTAQRRGRGFAHAGMTARPAVREIAHGRGFAEADVLVRWHEIVGADHAGKCRPVTVRYGQNRAIGATLIVHADSGRAPEVEHLGPMIVERVNQYYGYRAVSRLKVTQSADVAPGFAEPQAAFSDQDAEPTDADRSCAAEMARPIESPGLREALTRMGGHVLAQARSGPPKSS